jgi:hypothetical protein
LAPLFVLEDFVVGVAGVPRMPVVVAGACAFAWTIKAASAVAVVGMAGAVLPEDLASVLAVVVVVVGVVDSWAKSLSGPPFSPVFESLDGGVAVEDWIAGVVAGLGPLLDVPSCCWRTSSNEDGESESPAGALLQEESLEEV